MNHISVGVRLPSSLHAKLVDFADQSQTTKSEIIKAALAQYLETARDLPIPQRLTDLETKVKRLEKICHVN